MTWLQSDACQLVRLRLLFINNLGSLFLKVLCTEMLTYTQSLVQSLSSSPITSSNASAVTDLVGGMAR